MLEKEKGDLQKQIIDQKIEILQLKAQNVLNQTSLYCLTDQSLVGKEIFDGGNNQKIT